MLKRDGQITVYDRLLSKGLSVELKLETQSLRMFYYMFLYIRIYNDIILKNFLMFVYICHTYTDINPPFFRSRDTCPIFFFSLWLMVDTTIYHHDHTH